ncbi:MAG TPA: glycine--tRNA ligase subunit beta [Acetobacteraceae bacterium]|nr:glycine--tRNA ligase subunit beta [Acetobacteraceae bacterium]
MPELFIELFSEEIPARMQANAAAELARLAAASLAPLAPRNTETFFGPRRIALRADVAREVAAIASVERGPRVGAPEQALAGFLRKHNAARAHLREEGGYWVLEKSAAAQPAAALIAREMPPLLQRFPWPKSMRWGAGSAFTWVRPLRRIVCLLDGEVVRFDLRDGDDDGHGLAAADLTEGHRFHAPGPVRVASCADWQERLAEHRVLVRAEERRHRIAAGLAAEAAARDLMLVDDPALLDEVAGLVEWPVPLLGRIDPAFMDLPVEVMQVSMRVNQRYFALRTQDGAPAPWFGFAANIEAEDGGAAIIAGNERVLRARFADARHFWDLDRRTPLAERVPALDGIIFQAKLGSQGARVSRLRALARHIAPLVGADPDLADRAAMLAKADLVTGMVGEFPELQGVMGRYYALHDGEPQAVADAIRDHYAPKGPSDAVPAAPVSVAAALADKLDQLAGFFAIGEKPTGSGDPYALRRAALGVIRIVRENGLRLPLAPLIAQAGAAFATPASVNDLLGFIAERLRVQLRAEGARHDVLAAVFAAGGDDDLVRLLARADAVAALLGTPDGGDLLTAYRRAANILRIEGRKDGPHQGTPDPQLLNEPEELALAAALDRVAPAIEADLKAERFTEAMASMAALRAPLDAFFDRVTVNAPEPNLRRNRLLLLRRIQATMDRVADFAAIEG